MSSVIFQNKHVNTQIQFYDAVNLCKRIVKLCLHLLLRVCFTLVFLVKKKFFKYLGISCTPRNVLRHHNLEGEAKGRSGRVSKGRKGAGQGGNRVDQMEVTPWLNTQRGVRQRGHDMDMTIFQQMNNSLFLMYSVVPVATLSL